MRGEKKENANKKEKRWQGYIKYKRNVRKWERRKVNPTVIWPGIRYSLTQTTSLWYTSLAKTCRKIFLNAESPVRYAILVSIFQKLFADCIATKICSFCSLDSRRYLWPQVEDPLCEGKGSQVWKTVIKVIPVALAISQYIQPVNCFNIWIFTWRVGEISSRVGDSFVLGISFQDNVRDSPLSYGRRSRGVHGTWGKLVSKVLKPIGSSVDSLFSLFFSGSVHC